MRSQIKDIPRVSASETDKKVGAAIASYAALDRIRKLIPKLLPGDRAVLLKELADDHLSVELRDEDDREIRRLRTQLARRYEVIAAQSEVVEAARKDLAHDCVASDSCQPYANRPSEFQCGERDRLTLAIMNALERLDAATPAESGDG